MIHSVSIIDPLKWLNEDNSGLKADALKSSQHPTDIDDFNYALSIPNLSGRTFNFIHGLNVIVGPNGAGKSSLLSLISKVMACDGEVVSSFNRNSVIQSFCSGIFSCCKVNANYDVSSMAFTPPSKARKGHNGLSLFNGINGLKTSFKSSGQTNMITIDNLLRFFREDGKMLSDGKGCNIGDFNLHVRKPLDEYNANHPTTALDFISNYYKINNNPSTSPTTFILDTPDESLDIPNQKLLFNLFLQAVANPDKYQFIVSLNSLLLIQSLYRIKGVNWIDLEGDYLRKVVNINRFEIGGNSHE